MGLPGLLPYSNVELKRLGEMTKTENITGDFLGNLSQMGDLLLPLLEMLFLFYNSFGRFNLAT